MYFWRNITIVWPCISHIVILYCSLASLCKIFWTGKVNNSRSFSEQYVYLTCNICLFLHIRLGFLVFRCLVLEPNLVTHLRAVRWLSCFEWCHVIMNEIVNLYATIKKVVLCHHLYFSKITNINWCDMQEKQSYTCFQ